MTQRRDEFSHINRKSCINYKQTSATTVDKHFCFRFQQVFQGNSLIARFGVVVNMHVHT